MPHPDGVDATKFDESLAAGLELIGKSGTATSKQLTDFLYQTAHKTDEASYLYRRFLAAALWLESRPKWLIKGDGAEWEGRALAVAALKAQQRVMDADYGLVVTKASTGSVFAGTSR